MSIFIVSQSLPQLIQKHPHDPSPNLSIVDPDDDGIMDSSQLESFEPDEVPAELVKPEMAIPQKSDPTVIQDPLKLELKNYRTSETDPSTLPICKSQNKLDQLACKMQNIYYQIPPVKGELSRTSNALDLLSGKRVELKSGTSYCDYENAENNQVDIWISTGNGLKRAFRVNVSDIKNNDENNVKTKHPKQFEIDNIMREAENTQNTFKKIVKDKITGEKIEKEVTETLIDWGKSQFRAFNQKGDKEGFGSLNVFYSVLAQALSKASNNVIGYMINEGKRRKDAKIKNRINDEAAEIGIPEELDNNKRQDLHALGLFGKFIKDPSQIPENIADNPHLSNEDKLVAAYMQTKFGTPEQIDSKINWWNQMAQKVSALTGYPIPSINLSGREKDKEIEFLNIFKHFEALVSQKPEQAKSIGLLSKDYLKGGKYFLDQDAIAPLKNQVTKEHAKAAIDAKSRKFQDTSGESFGKEGGGKNKEGLIGRDDQDLENAKGADEFSSKGKLSQDIKATDLNTSQFLRLRAGTEFQTNNEKTDDGYSNIYVMDPNTKSFKKYEVRSSDIEDDLISDQRIDLRSGYLDEGQQHNKSHNRIDAPKGLPNPGIQLLSPSKKTLQGLTPEQVSNAKKNFKQMVPGLFTTKLDTMGFEKAKQDWKNGLLKVRDLIFQPNSIEYKVATAVGEQLLPPIQKYSDKEGNTVWTQNINNGKNLNIINDEKLKEWFIQNKSLFNNASFDESKQLRPLSAFERFSTYVEQVIKRLYSTLADNSKAAQLGLQVPQIQAGLLQSLRIAKFAMLNNLI